MGLSCDEVGPFVAPGFRALLSPERRAEIDAHVVSCRDCDARRRLVTGAVHAGPHFFRRIDALETASEMYRRPAMAPTRRWTWALAALPIAAAVAFALLLPGRGLRFRGGEPAPLDIGVALDVGGTRQPLARPAQVGDTLVVTVYGPPGAEVAAWVAVGAGNIRPVGEARVADEGRVELPTAWQVDDRAPLTFIVAPVGVVPTHEPGGWRCGGGPCTVVTETVR